MSRPRAHRMAAAEVLRSGVAHAVANPVTGSVPQGSRSFTQNVASRHGASIAESAGPPAIDGGFESGPYVQDYFCDLRIWSSSLLRGCFENVAFSLLLPLVPPCLRLSRYLCVTSTGCGCMITRIKSRSRWRPPAPRSRWRLACRYQRLARVFAGTRAARSGREDLVCLCVCCSSTTRRRRALR